MRTALFVLLALLILASFPPRTMTIGPVRSIGNVEARSTLMSAFSAVQKADSLGAPLDQVAPLSAQLNVALSFYDLAVELSAQGNITSAEYYFTLSNTASTLVLDKALSLQSQAEATKTSQQILAYSVAIIASIASSLTCLEYHRFLNFLRRRALYRTKLSQGDASGQKK